MDDETRCYNAFLWLLDQPSSNLSSWRLSFVFSSSHGGWPYIYMYIAIDRSFPPATHIFLRARFQLFTGKNSVRTNERTVGCCKTANETLQGLDALNSKRAPFRTPFLRHLPAGTSVLVPSQPEMQYGRRGENNAQLAALFSFPQKSLCVCASRYTNVFPRTCARTVTTTDLKFEKRKKRIKNRADVIA